jgi:hypothetical protein
MVLALQQLQAERVHSIIPFMVLGATIPLVVDSLTQMAVVEAATVETGAYGLLRDTLMIISAAAVGAQGVTLVQAATELTKLKTLGLQMDTAAVALVSLV